MHITVIIAILALATCCRAAWVDDAIPVESSDGTAGGAYMQSAQSVLGFFGAVTDRVDSCDLRNVPAWLAPAPYFWQMNESADSWVPVGDGPYDDLPVGMYRANLDYALLDGTGLPFGGPLAPTTVTMQNTYVVQVPRGDDSSIQLVIYRPLKKNGGQHHGKLPVIVYYHGGGMVLCGDPQDYAGYLTRMAAETQHIVVWVGYALAPERRYPAAGDDAFAAGLWVKAHIADYGGKVDGGVTLAGDSAGGYFALAVALKARANPLLGFPSISNVVAVYPAVDWSIDVAKYESLHAEGWCNTFPLVEYYIFRDIYFGSGRDPSFFLDGAVSPIYGNLAALPRTRIYTAEHDILRSEGEAFANAAYKAGSDVSVVRMMGATHPALVMTGDVLPDFAELREWFFADLVKNVFA